MKDKKHFKQVMGQLFLGLGVGFVAACIQFYLRKGQLNWSQEQLLISLGWIFKGMYVFTSLSSVCCFLDSNREFRKQEILEDDNQIEKAYLKAFRSQALATTLSYIGLVLAIPLIIMDAWLFQTKGSIECLILMTVDTLLLGLTIMLAAFSVKNLKETRGIKMHLFASPKEGLEVVYQYDEGERTILFEENFKAVYRLNVLVFPLLYVLVLIFSVHQFQLVALLILMGLHIYLNVVQYLAARKFYKN